MRRSLARPWVGIRRDRGSDDLLLTIASFVVTVVAVRVYLDAAGYPRVGGGGLHVAHMLWGGLLLVVAALVAQLLVGRRAIHLSAIAAGVGVGLFIDEVGKFITESNDYFFAPAAPIIYGAVLILLLVWAGVRRARDRSPAAAIHGAIDALHEAADGRLPAADRDRALARLRDTGAAADEGAGLGHELAALLGSAPVTASLRGPGRIDRSAILAIVRRWLPDRLERALIRIGLLLTTLTAIVGAIIALTVLSGGIETLPERAGGPIEYPSEPVWALALALVWVVVGIGNGTALVLSVARHDGAWLAVARYAIVVGLVAGGLLELFIGQLGALSDVLVQLVLLLLVIDQRDRVASTPAT